MKLEWTTTYPEGSVKPDTKQILSFWQDVEGVENQVINLYPQVKYQEMEVLSRNTARCGQNIFAGI